MGLEIWAESGMRIDGIVEKYDIMGALVKPRELSASLEPNSVLNIWSIVKMFLRLKTVLKNCPECIQGWIWRVYGPLDMHQKGRKMDGEHK